MVIRRPPGRAPTPCCVDSSNGHSVKPSRVAAGPTYPSTVKDVLLEIMDATPVVSGSDCRGPVRVRRPARRWHGRIEEGRANPCERGGARVVGLNVAFVAVGTARTGIDPSQLPAAAMVLGISGLLWTRTRQCGGQGFESP